MNILVVSESFVTRNSISNLFSEKFKLTDIKVVSNLDDLDNTHLSKLDFAFIDVNKNNIKIIENLVNIKKSFKRLKIMVLDFNKSREIFLSLNNLGLDGYIINLCDEDEFIYIVKKVMSGKKFYDSELLKFAINKPSNSKTQNLTNKELEVLKQVAIGLTNKNIANNLGVTDYTIKKHVSNILSKLNLSNRQSIVMYARNNDLLDNMKAN